jgi:glycerate 2-kinase
VLTKDSGARPAAGLAAQLLQALAREAVAACEPAAAVRRAVHARPGVLSICGRPISLGRKGRLYLVAFGKAAPAMTAGFVQRFKEAGAGRLLEALVVHPPGGVATKGRKAGSAPPPALTEALAALHLPASRFKVKTMPGEHPVPLKASFAAGKMALRFAARATSADDIVFLAAGGGSALMAAPLPPLLKEIDKTNLHRVLLTCGAPISSVNTVRKHLSAVKGGRLAIAARRAATSSTLVMCDVDPERFEDVASGPSLPDRTTVDDMIRTIDRYGIAPAIPVNVLEGMRRGRLPETPKAKDGVFRRSRSEVILSNRDLRNAAVRGGLTRGLPAEAMPTDITGSTEIAVEMVARAIETAPPGTRLLVLGGESVTSPPAVGEGGRAQELALRLALRMAGLGSRPWAFLAMGSDGIDGNSPAAGAYVDQTTLERARAQRLDPQRALREAATYRFFKRLGDEFVTGPTGTNVRDLYLLLTGPVVVTRRATDPLRVPVS